MILVRTLITCSAAIALSASQVDHPAISRQHDGPRIQSVVDSLFALCDSLGVMPEASIELLPRGPYRQRRTVQFWSSGDHDLQIASHARYEIYRWLDSSGWREDSVRASAHREHPDRSIVNTCFGRS